MIAECTKCGEALANPYRPSATGLCARCYPGSRADARRCVDCGAKLSYHSTGRCRPCSNRWRRGEEALRKSEQMIERARSEPRIFRDVGNFGTLAQDQFREATRMSSAMLAATIERAGLKLPPTPTRKRTFEEQLALVEQGRARLVEKMQLPAREPEFSVVGGTDWGGMG